MGKIKTVVWDWNGTLFEDLSACIKVENEILVERGLPTIDSMERYFEVFTFPIRRFYENLGLDFTNESFEALSDRFVVDYEREAKSCKLRGGTEDTLISLQGKGISQIVLSASSQQSLQNQMSQFEINHFFDEILGIRDNLASSKIWLAEEFMERNEKSAEEVIFVGDTVHDFEVASAVGCSCILLEGGHHSADDLANTGATVLANIDEVPSYINSL